jgi:hypothetical protein
MTMLRATSTTAALLLIIAWSGISAAESAAPLTQSLTQSLTQQDVQRFLQSMPDVEKLGEKYGDDDKAKGMGAMTSRDQMRSMGAGANMAPPSKELLERAAVPLTSSLAAMRGNDGYEEMVATVKRHGFSSVEEWATIGDRSIRAYAALQMEDQAPKVEAQMKEMRENLAKSGMPPAQQEAMLQMMNSSAEVMNTFADVPAADKQAVKPFSAQFERMGQGTGSK